MNDTTPRSKADELDHRFDRDAVTVASFDGARREEARLGSGAAHEAPARTLPTRDGSGQ